MSIETKCPHGALDASDLPPPPSNVAYRFYEIPMSCVTYFAIVMPILKMDHVACRI